MRSLRMLAVCTLVGLTCRGSAHAQDAFEQEVERAARDQGPEVEQAMRAGKAASDKADYAAAAKYYATAAAKAPSFAHALRRQCGAEMALGHVERGIELCRAAVAADAEPHNTTALAMALATGAERTKLAEADALLAGARASAPNLDVIHFADFYLARARKDFGAMHAAFAAIKQTATDKLTIGQYASALAFELLSSDRTTNKDEASRLAREALASAPDDLGSLSRVAQVGFAVGNAELVDEAATQLEKNAPALMLTHYFRGIAAAMRGDWSDARKALAEAKAQGLAAEQYAGLIAQIDEAEPWPLRVWPLALRVFMGWSACLLFLLVFGSVLSVLTLRAARDLPTRAGHGNGLSVGLRKTYTTLIALACAFYYVSLPLVLVAVLGSAAGITYGFMALGRVPIKLVLVLGLGALISVWAVLKSLFVRVRDEDPGTKLDLASEPGVRALLDEVAAKVSTRAVDSVYLTPGTDVAVFERGGMMMQMRGHSERCLVLGLGVLDGMRLTDLKAILAHEYGHFSNRDTAGGGLALTVRRSLISMAQSLAQGGAATWYNPAWWFFRGFFAVFLRVSQGASRLQEVLADRWAAFSYGSEAFVRGLSHVIDRSVRFDAQANVALAHSQEPRRAFINLYMHLRAAEISESDVALAVQEALERKPTVYDSHPAPRDRISWVRALAVPEPNASEQESARDAWSVFANREQLEQHMTAHVNAALGLSAASAPEAA